MAVRVLDLFSGIGGFSLALRSVAITVAYCEINQDCRVVLSENMRNKRLDNAPMFDDVTTLTPDSVVQYSPTMITAGFPCQDISGAIAGKGIMGSRSRLFFHIPRLIRGLPTIQHVFLENSPQILHRGWTQVCSELRKLGFKHIAYGVFRARDVGAPHMRARWYCLASRSLPTLRLVSDATRRKMIAYNWDDEPGTRLLKTESVAMRRAIYKRCEMLGNAVVPQCAALAYCELSNALAQSSRASISTISRSEDGGKTWDAVRAHKSPPRASLLHWPTPTVTYWYPTQEHKLTDRNSRYIGTRLYYEETSVRQMHGSHKHASTTCCIFNPSYVEYMMGYPVTWTQEGAGR